MGKENRDVKCSHNKKGIDDLDPTGTLDKPLYNEIYTQYGQDFYSEFPVTDEGKRVNIGDVNGILVPTKLKDLGRSVTP